ncbi:M20 aminoacylase family protein [Achromobacter sp.]|uniref:M20 aminoacylase family protein n=1 Tax=Achromobacter sp. TaxID=134375 RepID=UPI003C79582A
MNIISSVQSDLAELTRIRRDIHAHPELGYTEERTASMIAQLLRDAGLEVHTGIGKTGVVGVLKKGSGARSIGLRADMDALPIQELNQFAHASRHEGVMHACGHDGHSAMLLGAARYLAREGHYDGTVHFVFQPAEESGAGAKAMIEDGLFERFPMQAIFGMHNRSGLPVGKFGVNEGAVMASSCTFRVVVQGRGGHGGRPQLCVDPVPPTCEIVLGIQSIVARNLDPHDPGVVSVTRLRAGEANNVIPDHTEFSGTIRIFSAATLELIERRIKAIAGHVAAAHDCECEVSFERGYPATINDPEAARLARRVMRDIVGDEHVLALPPLTGSEDFAFYQQRIPGAYVFIGNGCGDHREPDHGAGPCVTHNASYDFNDGIIPLGATYWARLAEAYLSV